MNKNFIKVAIKDLYKSFGTKKVLQGINLEVYQGESLVVLGCSGSGKSVLIKCLINLITPDKGSIKLDGKEIINLNKNEYNKILKKFGFLFQSGALFDSLPIWQNIAFALYQTNKITKQQARALAIEKLEIVGLEERVADLYPAELSGGMQKRAALARAIALNPEIVFFDEPTAGLDPIMSGIINNLIIKISKELGATTITITHDINSTKLIADRVAMLYEGEIVWHDKTEKLFNSGNDVVDQFVKGNIQGPIKVKLQDH